MRRVLQRFWAKVEKTETCWLWTAGKAGNGYGSFWDGTKVVNETTRRAQESTVLSPRFYTTDFEAMDRIDVSGVRAEWDELMAELRRDPNKGHVQRMHAAFPPPGQAIAGWEVVVRLAQATSTSGLSWAHAREVFKEMVAAVPAWKDLTWAREARPLALRFAGSRG